MAQLCDTLVQCLVQGLGVPADTLSPDATFEDLGLDSLALLELTVIYEERTGREPTDITPQSTLAEASAHLTELGATGHPAAQAPQTTTALAQERETTS
ncbi:acyl carrier protein [Streptomyces sp. NPDC023327]|uniref:acyl carrier protein n=1 Tax=Streptomyces sp. NPDC023327 TaxID=3157088 RepID=UPI0033FC8127